MCRLLVLAAFGFVFCSAANAQHEDLAKDGIVEREATIVGLKHLKNGNMKMKVKTLSGEEDEVTLDWKTMIYRLTKKNSELFAKNEGGSRFDKVYGEMNNYWKKVGSMSEEQLRLLGDSNSDGGC